jgi:hypothetical protein
VNDRYDASLVARNWDAMAATLAPDTLVDDRRRVVNAGIRRGRDVEVASMRAVADIGVTNVSSLVIATRGQHLALSRSRFSGSDRGPNAFHVEMLDIVEIDVDDHVVARVAFDVDDIDAAVAELDARYLAGEAGAYSRTWQAHVRNYATLNRHEVSPATPDWVNVDHRHGVALAPSDMVPYLRAAWDVAPDVAIYVEAVHRLSVLGVVVTHIARGSSRQGFDAEWREVALFTFDGDLISRVEVFDDTDLDAALATFDELVE